MASSEVEICNESLTLLGQDTITALTEDTDRARKCNLLYVPTRDEVLRVYPWNFATWMASLARIAGETPTMKYDYFYQLPADCLRVLGMEYTDYEYNIQSDRLLCDYTSAKIYYIRRVIDPNKFDSIFISALATRLASKLAVRIKNSRSAAKDLLKDYVVLLGLAESVDSMEERALAIEAEDWIEEHEGQ